MDDIVLWGGESSRAFRSHWALRELGINDQIKRQHVDIDLRTGVIFPKDENAAAHYRDNLHPDSRQPSMQGRNGFTLFESLAINYYLAKRCNHPELAPRNLEEEARVMQWSIWTITYCEDNCVNLMFSNMMRNAEKKAARQKPLKEGLQRPFASLDRWLAKNKYMLGDSRWSIADLNVCSVIQWGIQGGMDLTPYPNLARWWKESSSRPLFNPPSKV